MLPCRSRVDGLKHSNSQAWCDTRASVNTCSWTTSPGAVPANDIVGSIPPADDIVGSIPSDGAYRSNLTCQDDIIIEPRFVFVSVSERLFRGAGKTRCALIRLRFNVATRA